jgi:hypothetical protein
VKARAPNVFFKRRNDIPSIGCGHNPEPTFFAYGTDSGGTNEMTISVSYVCITQCVGKGHAICHAVRDKHIAQISSNPSDIGMFLCTNNAQQLKVRKPLEEKLDLNVMTHCLLLFHLLNGDIRIRKSNGFLDFVNANHLILPPPHQTA